MIEWIKKHALQFDGISDGILLSKAQKGNKKAFGDLYLKYLDAIYRYIFFRVNYNKPDAEDLTEMVFFKAWENLDSFKKNEGTFKAWIYKIAHNTVIDFYKKQKTVALDEYIEDGSKALEDLIGSKMQAQVVLIAIDSLSQEQKQVITLRFMQDLSYPEIAAIMNKKEDAIRALQYRALKQLRLMFKSYEQFR